MATTTSNLGLVKPAYNETADVAVINSNMDTVDAFAGTVVKKTAQTLTASEKTQVQTNIGAADAVGHYKYITSSAKTVHTMNIPNSCAFLLIVNSNTTGIHGVYHIATTAAGIVTNNVLNSGGITTTNGTNSLTFDIGDTARALNCAMIHIRGNEPTFAS